MAQNRIPISLEQIKNLFAQQNIIRIFIDSMPFGYGNQASNKNLMKKIRQLGFSGKFDVIYFNAATMKNSKNEPTKAKLARLFDLPSNFSDLYYDEVNNIEFIEAATFHSKKSEMDKVLFSFSGSQLSFCLDAFGNKKLSPDIVEMGDDGFHFKEANCRKEADIFVSTLFINVQPYYGSTPGNQAPVVKFVKSTSEQMIPFAKGAKQFFITPTETLDDAFSFIETSKTFKGSNYPSLKRFMLGLSAQEFHTIPIHGWPVQLLEKNPNMNTNGHQDYFPGKILHYICGAAQALADDPTLAKKPLIIPVFYDYEEELEIIKNIIMKNDWGNYKNWQKRHPDAALYLKSLDLKNKFKVANLKDKNAILEMNELQPGEIMLLSTGKQPQTLFNGLYLDAGGTALTHVFEGENTRNALLSSRHKPFLRSEPWNLDNFGLKPNKQLQKKYDAYDSNKDFLIQSKWIADFILAAQKNNSEIKEYFDYIYDEALNPENDRIISTIKEGINILLKDKLVNVEELNRQTSSQSLYDNYFNSVSNVFKKVIAKQEAKLSVGMSKLVTSCPAYFHQDFTYWKNDPLNPQAGSVCCSSGFFAYQNQCIAQPRITANPIQGYLKF